MIYWREGLRFTWIPANKRNDPVEKSRSSTEANANSGAAMKAKHVQGYVRHSVASKSREGVVSPPLSTGEATRNYAYGIR